jgi:hypothetical protein
MEALTRKEKKKPSHEKAAAAFKGPYTERGARAILARQSSGSNVKSLKSLKSLKSKSNPTQT